MTVTIFKKSKQKLQLNFNFTTYSLMMTVAAYMMYCHDIVILKLTVRCNGCLEVKVGVKVTV
jgi:hypothetical protein